MDKKFPLCSKYGLEFVYGKDEDGLEKVYYEKDVELALSKAEAGTPHKLNSYSYKRGYEQGKLEAFLAKKTLEKNPETTALIDILESDWHTLKEKNPKIAREMLKHYVDMWNIPVSGYGNDEVIEMILDGRLSGINANGYWFAIYEQQKPYYVASRLKSQLPKGDGDKK